MAWHTRVRAECWPIAGGFRIARGARKAAEVIVVELGDGTAVGRGECVPYARYGETVESVQSAIEGALTRMRDRATREEVQRSMPPGAARNAIDCALWDLEAKRTGRPVWGRLGLAVGPPPIETMRTVSLDTPDAMGAAASGFRAGTTLKVKVGGGDDLARIEAVNRAAPSSPIVVDANESWTAAQLESWLPALTDLGVCVLEQPLPSGDDAVLAELRGVVPLCADESFHDRESFDRIGECYDIVNIKLDKAGGLTEAALALAEAHDRGLGVMIGCMVSTSLAVAPALLLASRARWVDLDGPFLLDEDRDGASHDEPHSLLRESARVWGA